MLTNRLRFVFLQREESVCWDNSIGVRGKCRSMLDNSITNKHGSGYDGLFCVLCLRVCFCLLSYC
jgi:hypothetical protein